MPESVSQVQIRKKPCFGWLPVQGCFLCFQEAGRPGVRDHPSISVLHLSHQSNPPFKMVIVLTGVATSSFETHSSAEEPGQRRTCPRR